jgi:hypothetical protein
VKESKSAFQYIWEELKTDQKFMQLLEELKK